MENLISKFLRLQKFTKEQDILSDAFFGLGMLYDDMVDSISSFNTTDFWRTHFSTGALSGFGSNGRNDAKLISSDEAKKLYVAIQRKLLGGNVDLASFSYSDELAKLMLELPEEKVEASNPLLNFALGQILKQQVVDYIQSERVLYDEG